MEVETDNYYCFMITLLNLLLSDKDVFCPDLLHTCRGNTNRSSSPAPAELRDSNANAEQHYADIDEIVQSVSQVRLCQRQQNVPESTASNDAQQTNNVPAPSSIPSASSSRAQCVTAHIEPAQPVMGQSLSQRRPRLSLTWVLRNQNQAAATTITASTATSTIGPSTAGTAVTIRTLEKKKFRSKSRDCTERLFSEKYVKGNADFEKTSNEYSVVAESPDGVRKLLFVCSKKAANNYDSDDDEGCGVDRRSDRSRKSEKFKRSSKLSFKNNLNNNNVNLEKTVNSDKLTSFKEVNATTTSEEAGQADDRGCIKTTDDAPLKSTYSEPSLCTGDTGLSRRHRHRRRRERNRSQRFGYEIKNVDDFLSKVNACLAANQRTNSESNLSSFSNCYSVRFRHRQTFRWCCRHPAPYIKLDQVAIKSKYHYH